MIRICITILLKFIVIGLVIHGCVVVMDPYINNAVESETVMVVGELIDADREGAE